jgi:hypothetical protein
MNARYLTFMGCVALMVGGSACSSSGVRARHGSDAGPDGPSPVGGEARGSGSQGGEKGSSSLPAGGRGGNGGGVAGGGSGSVASSFVDDGVWTLPLTGGPVWRDSTKPYCTSDKTPFFEDVWSDSRGIYAITSIEQSLYFNSGTGWSLVSPQPSVLEGMTGIPGGPLLLYPGEHCGVTAFDGKSETCLAAIPEIKRVFAVDTQRAFAIVDDRLLALRDSYFTPYGTMPAVPFPYEYRLWADAEVAVVAAEKGKVYVFTSPSSDPLVLTIPDQKAATALWGFGRNDLWVGAEAGRLAHYDGQSWTIQQVAQGTCAEILNLWGAENVLYFATENHVGRWRGGVVDTVLDGPCALDSLNELGVHEQVIVDKIWGNSPNELFIALYERKQTLSPAGGDSYLWGGLTPDACGQARMYWFDGQRLGRL